MSIKKQLEWLEVIASSPPTDDVAEAACKLIHKDPFKAFFFGNEGVHPAWLQVLSDLEFFSALPTGIENPSGGMSFPSHPPLRLLQLLIADHPREAVRILESLKLPENPSVADQVLRCVRNLSDADFIPLVTGITSRALEISRGSALLWARDIFLQWIKLGARKEVIAALPSYLWSAVGSEDPETPLPDSSMLAELDREVVEHLMAEYPLEVAQSYFEGLKSWAIRERAQDTKAESGLSDLFPEPEDPDATTPHTYWLQTFEDSPQLYHELEGTLAHRLGLASNAVFEDGKPEEVARLDELLRSDKWHLFERLRWLLYAKHPDVSKEWARLEVLPRLEHFGKTAHSHSYEFALLLKNHSEAYRNEFLKQEEVVKAAECIFAGPEALDNGDPASEKWCRRFWAEQLWPIEALLQGRERDAFEALKPDDLELSIETYNRYRSFGVGEARTIEEHSPDTKDQMAEMTPKELLASIREWMPRERWSSGGDEWWKDESHNARAAQFSMMLEEHPDKLSSVENWWDHVTVPNYLYRPLSRATLRISKGDPNARNEKDIQPGDPSELEWDNWFGMAHSILNRSPIKEAVEDKADASGPHNWTWARREVVSFLGAAMNPEAGAPARHQRRIGEMLRELATGEDQALEGESESPYRDWLSVAINSSRGESISKLIKLAHFQKKSRQEPEEWIFSFLDEQLRRPDQSPAVFAVFGGALRLAVHLFGDKLRDDPDVLLPENRPEHLYALISSHFMFDSAWAKVLEVLPMLPDKALAVFAEIEKLAKQRDDINREARFGSRLGTQLGFYYWNNCYESEEVGLDLLDRFFAIARPSTRGATIAAIGSMFEKANEDEDLTELFNRAMALWERRFEKIEETIQTRGTKPDDFTPELQAFIGWIPCECFPFEWRVKHVLAATSQLKGLPHLWSELEALDKYSADPQRLAGSVAVFRALTECFGDEFRWSLRPEHVKPLLARGIASKDASIVADAQAAQENLLKRELFEYRELE